MSRNRRRSSKRHRERPADALSNASTRRWLVWAATKVNSVRSSLTQRTHRTSVVPRSWYGNDFPRSGWNGCVTTTSSGGCADSGPHIFATVRFCGTCYRAANWICVGQTQGRGKLDTRNAYALPVKDILLKPIHPHWRTILNR